MRVPLQPRRELIPYIILAAAVALTAGLTWYAHVSGTTRERIVFEGTADGVRAAIESRFDTHMAMLLGGAGLFAASDEVTLQEFRRYVARLRLEERYPGIQGIGFTRVVRPDERLEVLERMRAEFPEFRFWPEPPDALFTAIVYLEPLDERNRIALGYDMASEEVRAEAMSRARDEARPAATGVVELVQERHDPARAQAGFLIYVPLYAGGGIPETIAERRQALEGFVYSPFRADDLLSSIFPRAVPTVTAIDVFEGTPSEGTPLHRRRWESAGRFTSMRELDLAGRRWTIVVEGGGDLQATGSRAVVALVGVGGLLLSSLLFAVTKGQVVARVAAERRAEELRASEERLRAADRTKDEFLATVSHELRTPLNAIVGWISILRTRQVPPDMQARAISAISRNAAGLTRLVDDLLDMSRAAAGHLDLRKQQIDARAILQNAVDALQPLALEAGVSLDADLGTTIGTLTADPGRVHQIVTNLVSNAIKFTRRGGRVTVTARREEHDLVFSVTDTGIGIDPAFMPFLFERFRQADSSSTRAHGGTGLGLAIVHHLVQLHGGTVEAASPGLGQGSTFTVRLPDRRGDAASGEGAPARDAAAVGRDGVGGSGATLHG